MSTFEIAKRVATFTTAPAIGHVVGGALTNLVPQRTIAEKVMAFYGRLILTSLITQVAREHVDHQMDQLADWVYQNTEKDIRG